MKFFEFIEEIMETKEFRLIALCLDIFAMVNFVKWIKEK